MQNNLNISKGLYVLLIIVYLIFLSPNLFSANISVPEFEMVTHGKMQNNSFILSSYANINFHIEGGYKFGGKVSLSAAENSLSLMEMDSDDIASIEDVKTYLHQVITLQSIQVNVKELFDHPLSMTYFTGILDPVVSGRDFPRIFGARPIASSILGYLYYPGDINYEGIHQPSGTGFRLSTENINSWFYGSAALYQDGYLGPGKYSAEIRSMINLPNFKMEAYLGASFPVSSAGLYRMGLLLFYSSNKGGEFLTQIGIPRWDPGVDTGFNINHFFFLFEPRVKLGNLTIYLTLFWHPEYYLLSATGEAGAMDINTKFMFGNVFEKGMSGGIENMIRINPYSSQQLEISLAPFYSIITNGVIFDFKLKSRVFPFSVDGLVQGYIGIRTEF